MSAPTPRVRRSQRLVVALTAAALTVPTALLVAAPAEARTGSKLSVQGPKKAQATKKVTFKGKVRSAKKRRVVKVHVRQGKKWKQVRKLRTTKAGAFNVKLGTGKKVGKRVYRFTAPRTKKFKKARVRKTVRVTPKLGKADNSALKLRWSRSPVNAKAKSTFNGAGSVRPAGTKGTTYAGWNVALQRQHRDGWKRVARTKSSPNGSFSLSTKADWLHALPYRVVATAPSGGQTLTSATRRLKAKPGWKPRGNAAAWDLLSAHDGVSHVRFRWDACGPPIRYRVNLRQAKGGQKLSDVKRAVAEVSRATGLKFKYRGKTKAHAFAGPNQGAKRPKDIDLLISWTRNNQSKGVPFSPSSSTVGYGGLRGYGGYTDARGKVLKGADGNVAMRANWPHWNKKIANGILLHEIGHAVGLAHSPQVNQVMYYSHNAKTPKRWGKGDLTGLNVQGYAEGCMTSPGGSQASARSFSAPTPDHDHDHDHDEPQFEAALP